jgi:hypothetical protein
VASTEINVKLFAIDVFTPNDFPEYTYIARTGPNLEKRLEDAIATPKMVVSISGPSKSGKTVLVEKTVGKDNLIVVSGAEVGSGDELWSRVIAWMGGPISVAEQTSQSTAHRVSGEVSGKAGLMLAEAAGKAGYDRTDTSSTAVTESRARDGLNQIVKELGNSSFVLLLDDFHYIPKGSQADVARQIKAAAERGVRICIATVPHRADDVVRTNAKASGRNGLRRKPE